MSIVFSGMQPTGDIHLGNYLAMVKPLLNLANTNSVTTLCSIVDLHAITIPQNSSNLYNNTLQLAAFLLACGVDNHNVLLFIQSQVPYHAELAWILGCTAKIGWLNRMIQFKEKSGDNKEKASCGLYFYPALMAADILLYNADLVPVGEDQKQHLEFTRDVALAFNHYYNQDILKVPKPLILNGARIMSLKDGTKKMSKSDPNPNSKILFTDNNSDIIKKIKRATTDSKPIDLDISASTRPGAYNLMNIYALIKGITIEQALLEYQGKGFSTLKTDLADLLVNLIEPLRENYTKLLQDKAYILNLLSKNVQKVTAMAEQNLQQIKQAIGFINIK